MPSAPYAVEHTETDYRPPVPRATASPAHRRASRPTTPSPAEETSPEPAASPHWPGHLPRHKQPRRYRTPAWPTRSTARTASAHWPERDPDDTVTLPPAPDERVDHGGTDERAGPGDEGHPWLDLDDERALKERRPPSGYEEYEPDRPRPWAERLAGMWKPGATLSRRAVVALFVLGAVAVAAALFLLRDRPETVEAPEMVPRSAPADASTEAPEVPGSENAEAEDPDIAPDEDLVVHVGGEVEEPGLYTLPPGSRVSDAVDAAGGALPEADLDLLNLARPLADGEQILVGLPQPDGAPGSADGESIIGLNQADQAELETLPGIGEKKAAAILAHREALGGSFTEVEDLLDVKGIGPSTFDELEPLVTL